MRASALQNAKRALVALLLDVARVHGVSLQLNRHTADEEVKAAVGKLNRKLRGAADGKNKPPKKQ